jgi:alpha-1,2-mannosyltransferase
MVLVVILVLCLPLLLVATIALRLLRFARRQPTSACVAFFHPYCNAGGGGERVLWRAVQETLAMSGTVRVVVMTGDAASDADILALAKQRFGLALAPERVSFVRLRLRFLVEAELYPHFTMLLQSLGSVLLALEGAFRCQPDVFFDSMGFAFAFPVFRWMVGSQVCCYVHYPTISTDMLDAVAEQRPQAVHNAGSVRQSAWRTRAKLIYYRMFARLYRFMGARADVVMTNSSWTNAHIRSLWQCEPRVVYPPCDTSELSRLPLAPRRNEILSVAQFRPEKDHALQLRAFALLLSTHPELERDESVVLVLLGGMRNEADRARVDALRELAAHLGVAERVRFELNAPLATLHEHLGSAAAGLHTMWNEHFGIGVVELMAAGVLCVAHNSGGPKSDIVQHGKTGYLAATEAEYAACLAEALALSRARRREMQTAARRSMERFSDAAFAKQFQAAMRGTCVFSSQ